MMPWSTPASWSAGEIPTAAKMNAQIRDNLNAVGVGPYASARVDTAQSIVASTTTTLGLMSDPVNISSSDFTIDVTNDRIIYTGTVPVRVLVTVQVFWASSASGVRLINIRKNGSASVYGGRGDRRSGQTPVTEQFCSGPMELATNDYVDALVYQSSTGNLGFSTTAYGMIDVDLLRYVTTAR